MVQETIIVVARKIPGFKYDPALGTFKSWLVLIIRRRIEKQLKKRMPIVGQASRLSGSGGTPALRADETKRTATVERVPDPKGFALEAVWAAEWEKNLSQVALAPVKARVKPKQFQMFDLYVFKDWSVKEVARALGVTSAQVYVNKHRLAALLKKELRNLQVRGI